MAKTPKKPEKTPKSTWKPDLPFNDLPMLPPTVELETRAILKACILARAALAELKQAAEMIPNQAILINTLPLLESQASNEIENIVTTTDKLFQHQYEDDNADAATKEALRYSQSLYQGFRSIHKKPLNTRTAEEICTQIKNIEMKVRKVPGTALGKDTGEVVYTPPEGEDRLRNLLANWEQFLHNETEIDPLVRMAVSHYQFEAIHPFTDGNGRTGRVLNSLFLIHEGLLTLPILYLSRYIIENKADYYRLLLEVTLEQKWEAWTLYMLKGVEETSAWTKSKIDAILKLFEHTTGFAREHAAKAYSHELISLIFELPYCRIQNVVDMDGSVRQTAAKKLKQLAEIGILREVSSGREKLFIHPKLLRLLARNPNSFSSYQI
jgi:Fic family protein